MNVARARTPGIWLQWALRWLWLSLALLIICYAVLVSAVRLLLPAVDRYQPRLDAWLSDRLGTAVETRGISGEWRGLSPVLRADAVYLGHLDEEAGLVAERVHLEPDLLRSLLRRQLIWKDLRLGELSLRLSETAAGRWRVEGIDSQGEGNVDQVLDMLFHSDRIRFGRALVELHFYSGTVTSIEASDVQLEGAGDFRRLAGTVRLGDMHEASRFIFEGRGRPDQLAEFSGRGFVSLNELHFRGDLSGLARQWFPEVVARVGELHSNIHMDTWFEVRPGGVLHSQSRLRADRIPMSWLEDVPDARNVSADLIAWLHPGEDWGASLQQLTFEWRDLDIAPFDLRFRQQLGARWTDFSLALNRLDLETTTELLLESGLLPENVASVLTDLAPRGQAENLWADFRLENGDPRVAVRGNLRDVALDTWRDAPAARGVSGYFEVGLDHGMVELASDDLSLWYPQAYEDFMPYGRTRGRVQWDWLSEESRVQVDAGPVTVADQAGRGRVWLDLSLPVAQPGQSAEMTLMVQLLDSHSRHRDRYLPYILPDTLRDWLDTAIGDADIPRADFIWRGPFRGQEHRTVQLSLALRDGELAFDPQWPALEDIGASLYLNDVDLDVTASRATMMGMAVRDVEVSLRDADRDDPVVTVRGDVSGRVGDALALLQASPVADNLVFLDEWQADGDVTGSIDLHLPLQRLAADGRHRVTTRVSDGELHSPVLKFDFDGIEGPLDYDSSSGLQSSGLTGQLWGEPLQAGITADGERTVITMNGELEVSDLASRWWPEQSIASGETTFEARLSVEHSRMTSSRLEVSSELEGVALVLPEPLGKAADERRSLALTIGLPRVGESWRLDWDYGEELRGQLAFRDDRFERGVVALRRALPDLPEREALLLSARAETVDWRDWWERYESLDLPTPVALEKGLSIPILVDLELDRLETGWLALDEVRVGGGGQGGDWSFELDSEQAAGDIRWRPGEERAADRLTLELRHAHLPSPREMPGVTEPSDIDPRTFPDLTFSVDDLVIGERSWGAFGLVLNSDEQGAHFENLRGEFHGLSIVQEDTEQPATLHWYFDGEAHSTTLSGQFHAENLGGMLRALDLEPPLESRQSAFNLAWSWPGKPWEIRMTTLSGLLHFELEEGLFRRAPGAAADAALRVVGLFNFANWVRRLRLDFSDFFTEGVSFDRVTGGVMFREGDLVIDNPIDARLPSGQMRMTGQVDLVAETLDLRMVTTLPVGTNLPWVAALIGGLPAAAGVYLTSKIFSAQVDRLSSIGHHIHGDWDDPTVQVDRIFGDDGN